MALLDALVRSEVHSQSSVAKIAHLKRQIKRSQVEVLEESKYLKSILQRHRELLIDDKQTMNELIYLREENLSKNNKQSFRAFKRDFLLQIRQNPQQSLTIKSHTLPEEVRLKPLKVKIRVNKSVATYTPPPDSPVASEEPVYCFCRKGDSGRMIACDNPKCKIEWFHYKCMGLRLSEKTPSKWYCPDCRPLFTNNNKAKVQLKPEHKVVKPSMSSIPIVKRNLRTRS